MAKLIFMWMLLTGKIVPQEKNQGHQMYYINCKDNKVIEYAYKEEILEYIKTGTFEYNEDLALYKNNSKTNSNEKADIQQISRGD